MLQSRCRAGGLAASVTTRSRLAVVTCAPPPRSDAERLAEGLLHFRDALLDLRQARANGLDLGDGLAPRHRLDMLVHGILVLRDDDLVALAAQEVLHEELGRVGGGRVLDD